MNQQELGEWLERNRDNLKLCETILTAIVRQDRYTVEVLNEDMQELAKRGLNP